MDRFALRAKLLPLLGLGSLLLWPAITGHTRYLTPSRTFTDLGTSTLVVVILVYSLNLAMGYSGLLSLMHSGLLGLGGYVAGYFATRHGWKIWWIIPVALLLGAALGALSSAISLRATYLYFGVITLSLNQVLGEIAKEWRSVTLGENGIDSIPNRANVDHGVATPSGFGKWFTSTPRYFVILAFALAVYFIHRNLVRSRAGRAFQAVRESGDAASALGIRPSTTKVLAFSLSGSLGALAGVLFAYHRGFVSPSVVLDSPISLFGGLLLGGTATLAGPFLGVTLFAAVEEIVKHLVGNRPIYAPLILGIILWLLLVLAPKGLVGLWQGSRVGSRLSQRPSRATSAATTAPSLAWAEAAAARSGDNDGPMLDARGVTKSFGGIRALEGVDVQVLAREVHGIIGPNGSGKSTFVNCATGLYHADAGTISLFGRPAPVQPYEVAAAGVVRVFQVPHLFERVSVLENVLTGMHLRSRQNWLTAVLRLPSFLRDEGAARAEGLQLLALAGLGEKADWIAASLSHGQKRMLEVVRAVGAHPRMLILDEPATGLTSEEVASLGRLIDTLKAGGLSIVLIEHNVAFVMGICDRITVFDQGRVIAVGTPAQVQADPAVQRAYLGAADVVEASA